MYFSFESKKVIKIDIGYGEKKEISIKDGLFKTKKETFCNRAPIISVGSFLISEKPTNHSERVFSYVNVKKPMTTNTYGVTLNWNIERNCYE